MNLKEIQFKLKNIQKNIAFEEKDHKYYFKGKPLVSVTQFVKKHTNPFDPTGDILKNTAKKRGLTSQQLQIEWDSNNKAACDKGNYVHDYLERQLLGLSDPFSLKYVDSYYGAKTCLGWINGVYYEVIGTEVMLYSETMQLAGQVDLLLWDCRNQWIIVCDFKTNSKQLSQDNPYNKFMLHPFKKYPDVKFNHYALQTGIYGRMLTEMGFNVSADSILFHILPNSLQILDCNNGIIQCLHNI